MKLEKNTLKGMRIPFLALFLALAFSATTMAQQTITLSDEQVENLVRRSYQYVAMFNVIQKFALDPGSGSLFMDGFNKPKAATALTDHTMKSISRPNNDTLYQGAVLDLHRDPVIVEYPSIDSKYVVLETSGYDHYAGVPLASSKGDFKKAVKVLFYTDRTEGYQGQTIEGVDRIEKVDGDYFLVFLRAMPHQADPERMARIIRALESVKVMTLSEFQGKPTKDNSDVKFPAYGKTDGDVFSTNLLEVMQFVFNHTTFDPNNAMDQAVLAAYKPHGVEPGKVFDAAKVAKLDGARFGKIAGEVAKKALTAMTDKDVLPRITPQMFMPKGQIDLEAQVIQSVVGPVGLPGYQARYLGAVTNDGKPMNAQHDYVLRMDKDELPPATAFWSLTLYDAKNNLVANSINRYAISSNSGGYKQGADGSLMLYIQRESPGKDKEANWLPTPEGEFSLVFRTYLPAKEVLDQTWEIPGLVKAK